MAGKPPDLLKLRLPVSLLASLTQDSRLTVNRESKDCECKSSLAISRGADNASDHEHPLHMDEAQVDWYQAKRSQDKMPVNRRRLRHIGTTSHEYTLTNKGTRAKPKLDTSTGNLKRIGEQTRKLLDEERKRRKEIVRLNEGELLLPPEAIANEAAAAAKSLRDEEKGKKIPPEPKKRHRPNKRKRNDPTVDSYMPNAEHLVANAVKKEDKSNILRMHGLPIGVRSSDIRKFFHGLNPTIFVLPTFDGYIDGWDGNVIEKEYKKVKVKRYAETFRVYVKFQSVLVADAAMERSGESVSFDKEMNECSDRGIIGAAVALSTVSKSVAKFLEKHLAISIRKGEALSESLSAVETQIGSEVSNLAWAMAANKLQLDFRHTSTRLEKLFRHHQTIPGNTAQYNSLIKVYNQLIDEHETVERETSLLLMHTFDPSCIEDSAHRITHSVSSWLLDEIDVIENNLREARVRIISDQSRHAADM